MNKKTMNISLRRFIIVAFIILISVVVLSEFIRCTGDGLSKQEAREISDKFMALDFYGEFVMSEQTFGNRKKEWVFLYKQKDRDCEVYTIVDKCGTFHIAGIDKKCEMR